MKHRERADAGSIPALLGMFETELRFYREIAPEVGVRTPALLGFESTGARITLELENLTGWREGGDPVAVATSLKALHQRWQDEAETRWPWLNRGPKAAEAIGALYDRVWSGLGADDLPPQVRSLGDSLVGRVAALERDEAAMPRRTLVHGDASLRNVRTSPDGELVFLDWEDVRSAQGEVDLAWLLVSSVDPSGWDAVIEAYGPEEAALDEALWTAAAQGILSVGDRQRGSADAEGWIERISAAADRLV